MLKHLGSIIIIASMLCWPVFGIIAEAAQNNDRAKHPYDSGKALSEPSVFAEGLISTGDFESHPAFTPMAERFTFYVAHPILVCGRFLSRALRKANGPHRKRLLFRGNTQTLIRLSPPTARVSTSSRGVPSRASQNQTWILGNGENCCRME
jgi:hypothetical protein